MRIAFLTTCIVLAADLANAFEIPRSQYRVGNWEGGAYAHDATGEFSHCSISAPFQSGDELLFTVNREATVSVAVLSPALRGIPEGQTFPVALFVDRRQPFYADATMLSADFAALKISEFDRAMESFKKGYVLRIEGHGRVGHYDLKDSFRALERARQCALDNFYYVGPRAASNPSAEDKTVQYQIATEFIAALGLSGFKYLSAQEILDQGLPPSGVYWDATESGIFGGIVTLPYDGSSDLRSTDAGDTQYFTKECGGDFASSARNVSEAARPTHELRIVCKAEQNPYEVFVGKMVAGTQVLYTILKYDDDINSEPPAERAESSTSATIRAAQFIAD